MESNAETKTGLWRKPLTGWRWLAAWLVLLAIVTPFIRAWILISADRSDEAPIESPWLTSLGITVGGVIVLALVVRCFCSRRNFERFAIGLAVLAVLAGIFYAEENLRGLLAWKQFKREWEKKGEKFDFAALVPPTVPAEQNFAAAPLVASSYANILDQNGHRLPEIARVKATNRLDLQVDFAFGAPTNGIGNWMKAVRSNLGAWQEYYRKLSLKTNLFPVPPQAGAPAADVLLALSKYDSTLAELRQAAALPASRFPLNYDSGDPDVILLPHLASMKACTKVLQLRTLAELENGQSAAAQADVILALQLTDKIRSEPTLISQLVRITMLQIVVQTIWEGLAQHRWTDNELAGMEHQLAQLDFVADYEAAMRAECATHATAIDYYRRHPGKIYQAQYDTEDNPVRAASLSGYLIPSGWFYQNAIFSSKFILERYLPIADATRQTFFPAIAGKADASLKGITLTPYHVFAMMFMPSGAAGARKFALAQATVNLCRTACALERYRLALGKYPETLDALAPQFIAQVPHDPIGGEPLHYRLTDKGDLMLYSIGWNEKDDGGAVVLNLNGSVDVGNGDLAWRYPNAAP